MAEQLWHIAWSTFGAFPPHDQRGRWTALAEFYLPLVAAGSAVCSHPLPSRYLEQSGDAILLVNEDATQLRQWLSELTSDGGDRVAGGHPVSAAAFGPTQAQMLFRCQRDNLHQVVGRIKSRLAALLLFERRWSNRGRHVWAKGFWAAELRDDEVGRKAKTFVERSNTAGAVGSADSREE